MDENNNNNTFDTMLFPKNKDNESEVAEILRTVNSALEEKGYKAVNQIVGYLLSGDPAYITSHKNARNLIRKLDRDELLEELVNFYIQNK